MSVQKELQLPPLSHAERSSSHFSSHDERHSRPSQRQNISRISKLKVMKTKDEETFVPASTWPAQVTSQIVQKPRETRQHGSLTKPRFLERLECYLKRELEGLDIHDPKFQELKLQVYQEVFGHLIEEFKTYKPLFSAIKKEYDITLAHLREQIRDLRPLRGKLVLVSEQCEKRVLDLMVQERDEIRALKQECLRLKRVIESMRGEQSALQIQVDRLKEDLAIQYELYREERDARKLLITKISTMHSAQDTEHDDQNEEMESEDPVMVKMALQVCREDLTKARVELNRLQAEYGDVVPRRDWENLECVHEETLKKLEALRADFIQMKSEYDTLLEVQHKTEDAVQHSNQSTLQNGSYSDHTVTTPRPNWEECSDILGGNERCTELFEGQSSQKKLEILLQEIKGHILDQNEFFTGLGLSEDVPIYLRYEGKLKNLELKKADVIRIIKDIWRDKTAENEKNDDCRDLRVFLHDYLVDQYKEKAGNWAYSLMESIKNNLSDDFIRLFNDILTGKVDESIYHGQTQLLSHLLKVLIKNDQTECGSLTGAEFSEALRKAFPLKSDQDIEELLTVAQTELKSNGVRIAYQTLYTEDTDGKHKEFLSLVKNQASAERLQYISELRAELEGKGEVNAEHLRAAFKTIDPSLDSAALEWNLSLAFQTKDCQLQDQTLNTEVVLQRLSVANVNRAGPK